MEADWKKFSALIPQWRERYLAERNRELGRLLMVPDKTETERFWDAEKFVANEAKTLRLCLDDIRRSRMLERLWAMRGAGMLKREDLAEFSEELQHQIFDPM